MELTKKIDKILLKGGEILDLETGGRRKLDMIIDKGRIAKMGPIDAKSFAGETLDIAGSVILPGLMDMHVHLREPGREDEETIASGCQAAMAGGFTAVCPMPNTDPPCDSQEVVRFMLKKAEGELVELYPVAAVTKKRAGKEITEMADLLRAGAVAFSDDGTPVYNSRVMRNALEYSRMYGIPIIDHCDDPYLLAGGHMNEGLMSTRLGISPIPDVGEEIMILRNIALARYTGGRVHVAHLSTRRGLQHIRRAKDEGIRISCEVTPHHLTLTDQDLIHFDTNKKMNPPLRTPEDVEALVEGLKDGTIDVIASDHAPHAIEEKDVEFAAAPFGITGLETMVGVVLSAVVARGTVPLHSALHKMSIAPRDILGIAKPKIAEGEQANLTLIDPEREWTFDVSKGYSRSANTPYHGWRLRGAVTGVFNKSLYRPAAAV